MKIRKCLMLLPFVLINTAAAVNLTCIGKVDGVNTSKLGEVAIISNEIYGDFTGRTICNTGNDGEVLASSCKSWLSQVLASYASKTSLRIVYVSSEYATCSEQPTWGSAEKPHSISNWY